MLVPAVVRMNGMIDPIHSSSMSKPKPADADTEALLTRVEQCVKDISLGFEGWNDPLTRGPGLYFVITRASMSDCAAPMGTNYWPVEACPTVFAATDVFLEAAQSVALSCDGAVIVHSDGTVEERMVRVTQLSQTGGSRTDDLPFAGWMGARHMSALETSTRPEVIAAVTLSEENGRVTVFTDGTFQDFLATSLEIE